MTGRHGGPSVAFVLEQTLGHVSHSQNLHRTLGDTADADVRWCDLDFPPSRRRDRIPPFSNWTVRSSLAARAAVREMQRERPLDAMFVHTHVPATFLGSAMRRIPTIVSIDATPKQIDSLGRSYRHDVQPRAVEAAKARLHERCFRAAASLVTWSRWAADSLVDDYGVDPDLVDVIPPGVVPSQWRRPPDLAHDDRTVRILFVGGDFARKGGELLLDATERLRHDPAVVDRSVEIELHLVTNSAVPDRPGVHVHRGLNPNSRELIDLYHRSDIFALPTFGDCTPLVLAEAAAAGLPAVATNVGAIAETVIDGTTGHLVDHDVDSLATALGRLVRDPDHRRRLGKNATEHAARTMDAEKNAHRVFERLLHHARPKPRDGRVMLTVSGEIDPGIEESIARRERPLADYVAISRRTGAELLDRRAIERDGSAMTSVLGRIAGPDIAMAHHVFRRRKELDVVVTDGEQVGLPLALLLRLGGRRHLRHVMIAHRISVPKKEITVRALRLAGGIDEILVYATSQLRAAQQLFDRPGQRVRLIDFMVDTEFFRASRPLPMPRDGGRATLCTAGREFRDYPTLIEAVRDLDVDLVIASASPWSKRADNANDVDLPPNVTVTSLTQAELRDQLDASDGVVMPLQATDFQAGVTTILEAMAMERPVICTATVGQIDVVVDGVNGWYVPPGDVAAMRDRIVQMLGEPEAASAMGKQGRQLVEERADVRAYAELFADVVDWHLARTRQGAG